MVSALNRPFLAPQLLGVALLAAAGAAQAAHPLITDDSGTQGTGHWQLEANTDHTRVRDRAAGFTAWEREVNAALTYGLTETLDIAVNLPWQRLSATGEPHASGVGDTTVLAKWRLHKNEAQGFSLALRPEVTLPSGSASKGLGNGRATAALTLISTLERGDWTWLANAGLAWNDNRAGDRKSLWALSTAVLYAVTPQLSLAADVGIARAADPAERHEKYGLLGAIWHVNDDVDLDLGWRRSLGAHPAAHTLGAGVTVRW